MFSALHKKAKEIFFKVIQPSENKRCDHHALSSSILYFWKGLLCRFQEMQCSLSLILVREALLFALRTHMLALPFSFLKNLLLRTFLVTSQGPKEEFCS